MPLQAEKLFDMMSGHLTGSAGSDVVKKVQAVFLFEVREKKGATPVHFTVDLKNGSGRRLVLQAKSPKERSERLTLPSSCLTKT